MWRTLLPFARIVGTRLIICCGLMALTIAASFALAPPALHAETTAPLDTPNPVVLDFIEEWTVGNGLIYWAYNCAGDEFVYTAALRRQPVGGGTQRTLESIDDGARCSTFLSLVSTAEGLYYFDDSQSQLELMPSSAPFTPQPIRSLTNFNDKPAYGSPMREANGYLYWIGFQQILRTLSDGSGPVEIVVSTSTLIGDLIVVGNTVYWTDSSGVWTISVNCATLPCDSSKSQFAMFGANTSAHGLLYHFDGGFQQNYTLYWVQRTTSGPNTTYAIKGQTCSTITVCFLPVSPFTFYTATPNWFIGNLALANNTLYWTERDVSTPSNTTGDVKRKARSAAQSDPADTIATNQANIDYRVFVANDMLFFARRNTGIYSLPLNASAIVRDFEASALEATQAIQNLDNAAPLVAAKTTYVRAYGRQLSGPSTPNVEARLIGTRNGVALPGSPLQPINAVRALTTGGSFDRARLNDGWYFLLPSSWITSGSIDLVVEVDGRQIHTDPNRANNVLSKTVTFQNQPPVCVWTVPVRTHTPLPSINDPNFWAMVDQFTRRWPVPTTMIFRDTDPVEELQVCWAGPFPYPCHGPYELEDGWGITNGPPDRDKVIISLWGRALLSFNPDACDDIGAPVHFMGMVHPDANNSGASGYASTISNQSWVQLPDHTPNPAPPAWNSIREGSVMAQELAHNYGRKHINCPNGVPDNIDTSYPYPPCQIANVGPTSYYGFDIATRQPIRPDQTADFMTYASRSWVSDYTWRALMNSFVAARTTPAPAAAGDNVFVTGLVDMDNDRGKLATVLVLPAASVPPTTRQSLQAMHPSHTDHPHATYTLRLLDAANTVLVERTLVLTPLDDHSPDGASALFSDLFPAPAGTVATIQLLADGAVIDSVKPGAAAPTVSIQQPAGGSIIDNSLSIQWLASDADQQDDLLFTIQYSHDGGVKWHTLTTNYPSTPAGSYTLTFDDLGSLQGSTPNGALVRVLASDGYNTTIATSQPFTVKNRKPITAIITPVADQSFAADETVILRGQSTDPEDGNLNGNALAWSVDGVTVGTGTDVMAAGLAPGDHTAVLKATDSASNTATATVTFNVAPLSVPLASAPQLDGACEDAAYSTATRLPLQPYADGSQANAAIVRSNTHLWVCFSGMQQGAPLPGAFAGLRIDVDHSRSTTAQSDDYGFFVGEDGSVLTQTGDGAGGFNAAGTSGLEAQVSANAATWSAELRIDKTLLGGWDHLVGLQVVHSSVNAPNNDYSWPFSTSASNPATWATTALGMQPVITALDSYVATVADPAFTLTVEGSGFISGTLVLWNGTPLPTTFVDAEHLTAQVGAAQLNSAATVPITTRAPAPGNFESNAVEFTVQAAAPIITSLSPSSIVAGSPMTTLTVNGSNFAANSQVLWNGTPLPTTFVSASQLKVQLDAALLANGQIAGVAVRNQAPTERISNAVTFEIQPNAQILVYLPLIQR